MSKLKKQKNLKEAEDAKANSSRLFSEAEEVKAKFCKRLSRAKAA
jgi:hypothetical protein